MKECEKCGISENYSKIYDVIGKEGILHLCEKCAKSEGLPIIKRPSIIQLKKEEKIQNETYRDSIKRFKENKKELFIVDKDQEKNLRKLVEQNYKKTKFNEPKNVSGMVDNFNWKIMRARRIKKFTKKELAKEIGESETAIEMIEKGILPKGNEVLIKKLEIFLRIKLKKEHETIQGVKEDIKRDLEKKPEETIFDSELSKNITIGDLKEASLKKDSSFLEKTKKIFFWQKKKEKDYELEESPKLEEDIQRKKEIKFETDPFKKDKEETELNKKIRNRELSQEEIDKIIFGS